MLAKDNALLDYRGHIRELDGYRAIGTIWVLLTHVWRPGLSALVWSFGQKGWIAMDSFFVLSGFLISGILLDSKAKPDYYRNYYIRRALRILPVYYLVITAATLFALFWHGGEEYRHMLQTWGSPWWFFIYLGNINSAIAGHSPSIDTFFPLWSLQIEEQFYILFPFAIHRLKNGTLARVLWALVFVSAATRIVLYFLYPANPFLQQMLLPCRMEGFALGALVSLRVRSGPWKLNRNWIAAGTAILLAITMLCSEWSVPAGSKQEWATPFNRTVGFLMSSFFSAGLLLCLILFRNSKWLAFLRLRPMLFVGNLSYGIYILQIPVRSGVDVLWRAMHLHGSYFALLRVITVILLSIGCASLSWRFLEGPCLRLKERLTRPDRKREKAVVPELAHAHEPAAVSLEGVAN